VSNRWFEPVNATHVARCTRSACGRPAIGILYDASTWVEAERRHAVAACREHLPAGTRIRTNGSSGFRRSNNVVQLDSRRPATISEVAA
jgi:hypothetical protein